MTNKSRRRTHQYEDTLIYSNVDLRAKDHKSDDVMRERAVRKVVRAIIENEGGDGNRTKQDIETNYRRGIVRWKEERVVLWEMVR